MVKTVNEALTSSEFKFIHELIVLNQSKMTHYLKKEIEESLMANEEESDDSPFYLSDLARDLGVIANSGSNSVLTIKKVLVPFMINHNCDLTHRWYNERYLHDALRYKESLKPIFPATTEVTEIALSVEDVAAIFDEWKMKYISSDGDFIFTLDEFKQAVSQEYPNRNNVEYKEVIERYFKTNPLIFMSDYNSYKYVEGKILSSEFLKSELEGVLSTIQSARIADWSCDFEELKRLIYLTKDIEVKIESILRESDFD